MKSRKADDEKHRKSQSAQSSGSFVTMKKKVASYYR